MNPGSVGAVVVVAVAAVVAVVAVAAVAAPAARLHARDAARSARAGFMVATLHRSRAPGADTDHFAVAVSTRVSTTWPSTRTNSNLISCTVACTRMAPCIALKRTSLPATGMLN